MWRKLPSAWGVGQVHFVQNCTMLEQMSERKSQGQQRSPACHGPSGNRGGQNWFFGTLKIFQRGSTNHLNWAVGEVNYHPKSVHLLYQCLKSFCQDRQDDTLDTSLDVSSFATIRKFRWSAENKLIGNYDGPFEMIVQGVFWSPSPQVPRMENLGYLNLSVSRMSQIHLTSSLD